jgi:hypothetical protein
MKSYIIVISISALLLASMFFAFPKTERLLPSSDEKRFDLNKKENSYWKKEFVLELGEERKNEQDVEKTKDILYKRLRKIQAEEIQIKSDESGITVIVQSTQNPDFVTALISTPGKIKLMTPNLKLEELEEEEEFEMYSEENYTETDWNNKKFRNILINDLKTDSGDKTYFAIFKPQFGQRNAFKDFLRENQKEGIGVSLDGFVRPITVEPHLINLFAIAIAQDEAGALIQDIILNTETIPLEFSLVETNDLKPNVYLINHVQAMLAILASTISLLAFLYQREKENKEKILQLAFSTLLLFSLSLTVLKIWQIPVDLFLLIPTGILTVIFIKIMYTCPDENRSILFLTTILAILMITLATGYIPIMGRFLLFAILLSFMTEILTKLYFKHIKILNI